MCFDDCDELRDDGLWRCLVSEFCVCLRSDVYVLVGNLGKNGLGWRIWKMGGYVSWRGLTLFHQYIKPYLKCDETVECYMIWSLLEAIFTRLCVYWYLLWHYAIRDTLSVFGLQVEPSG